MPVRSLFLIVLILFYPCISRGQDLNSRILMNVDGRNTEAGEFIRMYRKSTETGKLPDVNTYLRQFKVFKLKVADALKEGYDTAKSFRTELNGYRNQLAANYLSDNQVKEKLLLREYERSLSEINAWHILVALPPNAKSADTLSAWKKSVEARNRIIAGESFETVAREVSDDKSVKINGGNLGWFSALQMVMPFENAVYSLKNEAVSMPVRTSFGYHIIKVIATRPSNGKIKVAHIMKVIPPGSNEKESSLAKEEIDTIYKSLTDGASFEGLAKKYSDHKESAANGGELSWFGTGEILSDFAEPAFALTDTGKYTQPVCTAIGWHIIKLIDRKKPGSFGESRNYLESRIDKSYLNSLSKKTFTENLKKEYNFRVNKSAQTWFTRNTDIQIMKGSKKYDRKLIPGSNLFTFNNNHLSCSDFARLVEKNGNTIDANDSTVFISQMIENAASEALSNYENSVLEKKYPEFRYLMNEFHDGMLLFQVSEIKIWNKVARDSAGLHSYYENNKVKWLNQKGISDTSLLKYKDVQEEVMNDYQEYLENKWLEQLNNRYTVKVDDSVWDGVKKKLKNE